jgi:hypothetical protein
MIDEELARLRAHGKNISRYRRLLERGFIERRLDEEMSAVESLSCSHPPRTDWHSQPV